MTVSGICRGANYIEVDVDVGSSRSAANVVGLVQGALKSLVIDLAVLLEGHCTVSFLPKIESCVMHWALASRSLRSLCP